MQLYLAAICTLNYVVFCALIIW